MKASKSGGPAVALARQQNNPYAIVVDQSNVYWTDAGDPTQRNGSVMTVAIAGGSPITLASEQPLPMALAVDSDTVYWTNEEEGTINAVSATGDKRRQIAAGQRQPVIFALDERNYYWNTGDEIVSAPKAGGQPAVLYSGGAGRLELAMDSDALYWVNRSGLVRVPKGGGALEKLFGRYDVTSFSLDEQSIYIRGAYRSKQSEDFVAKLARSGGPATLLISRRCEPWDCRGPIAVDDKSVYFADNRWVMKLTPK